MTDSDIERLRRAAQKSLTLPGVETADVIREDGRTDGPVAELTVDGRHVPPRVLRAAAEYDCGIYDATVWATGVRPIQTVVLVAA